MGVSEVAGEPTGPADTVRIMGISRPPAAARKYRLAAWVSTAKLGEVDHIAAETAQACLIVDAAVTVRNGLRELPQHSKPLIRELVA
jgi:hypothetical protein